MGLFGDPIGDGVRAGLKASFEGWDSPFGRALRDAFAPVGRELAKLRWRTQWHPIDQAPPWLKDGRPVFVSLNGDIVVASWCAEEGGYWDADVEYGGEAIKPDAFYVVPPCKITRPSDAAQAHEGEDGA